MKHFWSSARGPLILLGIGAGYYVWINLTHLSIPCPFRKVTGWLCPGCGITTMFLCLGRGDISGAFLSNPFLFATGPFLLMEVGYAFYRSQKGLGLPLANRVCLILYCVALCVFGVLRNLTL